MPRRNQRAEEQSQAVSNAAQTLFANIRFMSVDNPVHVLAITSSGDADVFLDHPTPQAPACACGP